MRRIRLGLAGLVLICILAGCGKAADETAASAEDMNGTAEQDTEEEGEGGSGMETTSWRESVQKMFEDPYGDYTETGGEIVLLTDGPVEDGGYNEAVYNGVRMYALGAGRSFSYYNANPNEPESYHELIERSAQEGARVIVCAGDIFGEAVGAMQETYPQTSFLLIDSVPHDGEGEELSIAENVHCVLFHEEEAGYLAGYMAVWEGYRNLGFMGGREEPAVLRYGYGYLQGIDAAAKDLSLDNVTVNYGYAGIFSPDIAVRVKADEWYENGTQIIFACGGGLYESVLEAAENQDGLLIGVDVDQARDSDRFLTSAVKNIGTAVTDALDSFYANGGWNNGRAGQVKRYGVDEGCAAIPVVDTEWRFKEIPTTHFFEIYKQLKRGDRAVSDDISAPPQVAVTVNFE
ncbi:MAG: BMP family ABC transporter substrate-binding protein [Lachnospiraceae bacterium]|nr:BMP family ABC transporter substrate-binding protein [Lachnospiraceae bacterium]